MSILSLFSLENILLQSLQRTLRFAKEETEAFYQMAMQKGEKEAKKSVGKRKHKFRKRRIAYRKSTA